ncbi:hypothetical protein JHK87_027354 [Glycine soja]|nr:hypothetical protein JHK87_027354 [Glycine soja]
MSSGDLLGNQAGGLDNRTLDSLYNDALRRNNQNASYDPWEPALGGNMMQPTMHNPFFASNTIAAPPFVQMASRWLDAAAKMDASWVLSDEALNFLKKMGKSVFLNERNQS